MYVNYIVTMGLVPEIKYLVSCKDMQMSDISQVNPFYWGSSPFFQLEIGITTVSLVY